MSKLPEPDDSLDLVLSTRQFAMLINSGTSLVGCMQTLQQEARPRLANVWREVQTEVERGETLSRAMGHKTEVFSPFYVAMVRAGEVGGVLDETLSRTADMLEEEWEFSRLMDQSLWTPLLMPAVQSTPQDWAELTEYQQKLTLLLLCRAWSLLLSSGVPITHTLQIAAELLPITQRGALRDDVVRQLREGTPLSESLAALGFLPPLVLQLWEGGEHSGNVDAAMDKAAQFYRYELRCRLGSSPGTPTLAASAPDIATQMGRPRLAEMDEMMTSLTDELNRLGAPATQTEDAYDENRYLWAQITPLGNRVLKLALALRASEIHLAWTNESGVVEDNAGVLTFRIESELREIQHMSPFLASQLISRFSEMADINGRLGEGHIHLRHEGQDYNLLVSKTDPRALMVEVRC